MSYENRLFNQSVERALVTVRDVLHKEKHPQIAGDNLSQLRPSVPGAQLGNQYHGFINN